MTHDLAYYKLMLSHNSTGHAGMCIGITKIGNQNKEKEKKRGGKYGVDRKW